MSPIELFEWYENTTNVNKSSMQELIESVQILEESLRQKKIRQEEILMDKSDRIREKDKKRQFEKNVAKVLRNADKKRDRRLARMANQVVSGN